MISKNIKGFKSGYWYRLKEGHTPSLNMASGEKDFMLDYNWHKCHDVGAFCILASFYDSSNPNYYSQWELGSFEECKNPVIEVLKRVQKKIDKGASK